MTNQVRTIAEIKTLAQSIVASLIAENPRVTSVEVADFTVNIGVVDEGKNCWVTLQSSDMKYWNYIVGIRRGANVTQEVNEKIATLIKLFHTTWHRDLHNENLLPLGENCDA